MPGKCKKQLVPIDEATVPKDIHFGLLVSTSIASALNGFECNSSEGYHVHFDKGRGQFYQEAQNYAR